MNLQRFNIKLNPKKCVFRVLKGKLLEYIMSKHGIEANPKKIKAISNMGPIRNVKGVQRLTGCLAALSRFISQLAEWGCLSTSFSKRRMPSSRLRKHDRLLRASKRL